jgi:predicted lipoprotein with Yx(FWY)xxD motif
MSRLGFVLALANGQVVYTYANDPAGGTPTCTGSCTAIWVPVTGVPKLVLGLSLPGSFSLVTRSDGSKQIAYNGHPLYTYKGARPLSTAGEGIGGVWHVVKLPAP